MRQLSRRSFPAGLAATVATPGEAAGPSAEERLELANKRLAEIEAREGGRLGVAVVDTEPAGGSSIAPTSAFRCAARSSFWLRPRRSSASTRAPNGSTARSLMGRAISSTTRRSRKRMSRMAA